MPTLSLRPVLMGGASLAVIALGILAIRDPALLDPRPDPRMTERIAEEARARAPLPRPLAGPDTATAEREVATADEAIAPPPPAAFAAPRPAPMAAAEAPAAAVARRGLPVPPDVLTPPDTGRDRFEAPSQNPLKVTAEDPVSTFSIEVDTASFAWVRRSLREGRLPDPDAVRVEEMVNYFPFAWPGPETRETPFATTVTVQPTPWNPGTKLMTVGIRGYDLTPETRPDANLVFLIDSSGSMQAPDRLPLLLNALRLLVGQLRPTDQIAIVTYAGTAGVALPPTEVANRAAILAALDRIEAGGGTAGEAGLREAYALAEQMRAPGETTRVMLATDGDFNIGLSDPDALTRTIAERRGTGIFLSVLGFGAGNFNDALMQRLAQNGNGIAAYVDSLAEARRLLVDGVAGSLFPIARDVKIQVEFNPATVAEYRLIGYETRALRREDFSNDAVDAGEIGAGHSVTAIYEITPVDGAARLTDPLRYAPDAPADRSGEYAFLRLRWKAPYGEESRLAERPVTRADEDPAPAIAAEARFAAAVAGFGQMLKGSTYLGTWSYADALALARANAGEDPFGYRAGLIEMIRTAETLATLPR